MIKYFYNCVRYLPSSNGGFGSATAQKKGYIIITGAAGFIGSCLVQYLNEKGYDNLILVDKFIHDEKEKNWKRKKYKYLVDREQLLFWLNDNKPDINSFVHLGACTDTTEFNYSIHNSLNLEYSQDVWNFCTAYNIPLIYASSAATYGGGENGYDDTHEIIQYLKPLNPYGVSKNEFDKWALQQINHPPLWAGLKFFNVYGPNEYHKNRMASVIFHSYNQIKKDGYVKLFKSHKEGFKDGEQLRDFVYVKDVVKVIVWMLHSMSNSGLTNGDQKWDEKRNGVYNLGTGMARTFDDLVKATFRGLDMKPHIAYIDMPEELRDKYQYFTEANMHKLKHAGYDSPFYTLEEGVQDYVRNYLSAGKIW